MGGSAGGWTGAVPVLFRRGFVTMTPLDETMMRQPTPEVVFTVNEQVVWWLSRGVTAADASKALGCRPCARWEEVRRSMEQWMMRRGA